MEAFLALFVALPAFIQSLPYLFQIILKLVLLFERFIDWTKKNNLEGWINDLETAIDGLEKASSVEDKNKAGRALIDLIRKLK